MEVVAAVDSRRSLVRLLRIQPRYPVASAFPVEAAVVQIAQVVRLAGQEFLGVSARPDWQVRLAAALTNLVLQHIRPLLEPLPPCAG